MEIFIFPQSFRGELPPTHPPWIRHHHLDSGEPFADEVRQREIDSSQGWV